MINSSTPNNYNSLNSEAPIGIFDSGIGGLTVMRRIKELLPNEHLVYFGDTARVPYGTKSQLTVQKYAEGDTKLLLRYEPKLIVIACNTVSALALDEVERVAGEIPVLGVIHAGAAIAAKWTSNKKIGVIGTAGTIASNAYQHEIHKVDSSVDVFSKACPLFVPLAEEGFSHHEATKLIAKEYLTELLDEHIDSLVLGCTHYPILRDVISEVVGKEVQIIDSAEAIAHEVQLLLQERNQLNQSSKKAIQKMLVSDVPQKFKSIAERFLEFDLPEVELVTI